MPPLIDHGWCPPPSSKGTWSTLVGAAVQCRRSVRQAQLMGQDVCPNRIRPLWVCIPDKQGAHVASGMLALPINSPQVRVPIYGVGRRPKTAKSGREGLQNWLAIRTGAVVHTPAVYERLKKLCCLFGVLCRCSEKKWCCRKKFVKRC